MISTATGRATRPPAPEQQIRFCRGQGGVRIAYAIHGSGPPVVVVSCWLSHLQHDWQSPVWRHFLDDVGEIATVIRYDERGFGLSDWKVSDFSLEARLADLEALMARIDLPRITLLGMSGGAPVALAYAARNPDHVSRLVLYGGAIGGWAIETEEDRIASETYRGLIQLGWAREEPSFRRVFTTNFVPDATEEQMRWFDDLQRMSTSTENAIASRAGRMAVRIEHELPSIKAPTLVLHATGDRAVKFEDATRAAALIPNSRLVPMDSQNHILLADEPAWQTFLTEVRAFLAPERVDEPDEPVGVPALGTLSTREREVLRLVANGQDNEAIAATLGLSLRTVERHLSNIYGKLGLDGRSARAAAVAAWLRAGN